MKEKYYCVPASSKLLKVGEETFYDILKNNDASLAIREEGHYSFFGESIFESPYFNNFINKYDEETKNLFKEHGLTYNILLKEDKTGIYELETKTKVETTSDIYLNLFKMTKEDILNYLKENPNYQKEVRVFYSNLSHNKVLVK